MVMVHNYRALLADDVDGMMETEIGDESLTHSAT